MIDKAFELTTKSLMGEELTEDEKLYLQKRNAKYALVRHIVMEKYKADGFELTNFHFSPGSEFDDTPTIDIVNSIMGIDLTDTSGAMTLEDLEKLK